MYEEPEIPAEFKLKHTLLYGNDKLSTSYVTWRIMLLNPKTGEVSFEPNNNGPDWKTETNAKKRAEWMNNPNSWWYKSGLIAIVKKCKVTVEAEED